MSVGNAKVGIWNPETNEEVIIEDGALHVKVIGGGGGGGGYEIVGIKNASDIRINPATEDAQTTGNNTLNAIADRLTNGTQRTMLMDSSGMYAVNPATEFTVQAVVDAIGVLNAAGLAKSADFDNFWSDGVAAKPKDPQGNHISPSRYAPIMAGPLVEGSYMYMAFKDNGAAGGYYITRQHLTTTIWEYYYRQTYDPFGDLPTLWAIKDTLEYGGPI